MSLSLAGPAAHARRWCLAAAVGLGSAAGAAAQAPAVVVPKPAPVKTAEPAAATRSLGECLAIALDRQPHAKAARASLAAALAGQRGIQNVGTLATLLSPDVPIRREQAARGVTVAVAEVNKIESETTYDVTFLYYQYVFASQQEETATRVIERMVVYLEIAQELLKQGNNKVDQFTVYAMEEATDEVRRLRVDAKTGKAASLAALKTAMGIDIAEVFVPRDAELPVMAGTITEPLVVDTALGLRPELSQAAAGVDAFRLEVCAQDKIKNRKTVPTLGAGSDLHSKLVPAPLRNGEYRPGALAPEMPTTLVGPRKDRVAKAYELSLRQDELYARTRDLVKLEATNAFYGWQAAAEKMALAKDRYDRSQKTVKLSRDLATDKYELLIRNEALAGKAFSEYLASVFDYLKSLARIERVTAGGLRPAFPNR